jgi:hypothetical protein
MRIEITLTEKEAFALKQLTQRCGFSDARKLCDTDIEAQHAIHGLFELQQAILKDYENAQSN